MIWPEHACFIVLIGKAAEKSRDRPPIRHSLYMTDTRNVGLFLCLLGGRVKFEVALDSIIYGSNFVCTLRLAVCTESPKWQARVENVKK